MRRLVRLAALAGLGAAASVVGACLGVEYHKVAALVGAGGEGGACAPFTGVAPDDCDPGLLGDANSCCVAGRSCLGGACKQGACQPVVVADNDQETVDVLIVGDRVVWSSGYDGRIYAIPLTGGPIQEVVADPTSFTTALATDGQRVFWVEHNGTQVYSVDPGQGSSSRVLVGDTIAGDAGWGRIAVAGTMVFWVNEGGGSLWAAAKDGSMAALPTLVAGPGDLHGVAADGTHVYWGDLGTGRVLRLAVGDIGLVVIPEVFADGGTLLTEIAIMDGRVYWIDDGVVRARDSVGGANSVVGSSSSGRGLAFDDVYVYWTSYTDGALYRAPRTTPGPTQIVATSDTPIKHLAAACDALFFTNYDDGSPGWIAKVAK